ncbi:iron-siderophore ABC transporter substrate-binding protein [Virgisporangium ochraceum]|uniref:Iron siderophore-binding protein n=1 Tax=Virgisporangium ochraceum TaxID=65505 RepID=A0A8J3ZZ99_9ACTN|nr:iron-siderophore ABC transporter substrate-binding protein [Virgisporangium ochraceum]GIJ71235.1 iron siderophore-binding protein [Virgisporangium ochraceum]
MRLFPIRRAAVAAAAGFLVLLAACGPNNDNDGGGSDSSGASGFPVSIENKFGTTTINSEPKRIVTVGLVEQDALLALGIVPVGTTEWFGGKPGAIWPWAEDELGSAAKPEVLTFTDGIQFEKIAALKPDLILALYSGVTAEDYATLSKMAPTVAQPKGQVDYGVSWQEATKTVGLAVGKKAQAEKLVADLDARFAQIRKDNPEFANATSVMATTYEGYWVYGAQDPRGRLLQDMGFTMPAGLDAVTGTEFGANLSKERVDLLDVKAIVWLLDTYDEGKAKVKGDPLYNKLKVSTDEREIFVVSEDLVGASISFISVLSLPQLLDKLVPQLKLAVDGNPATAVQRI